MARGKLRIFLGAAPGVGKTFEMLQLGNRELQRGRDVVIGFLETHGRQATADQVGRLETVPRRRIEYRGSTFTEMDVDAVLARAPEIALVDEYAHTNVPGSRNAKRWKDIDELLDAGINVVSTVNIQHLESLNDVVEQITGIRQRETVPDTRVRTASQIDLVDLPPESIRTRLARGHIYDATKIDAALGNFFRPGNLGALRELALLWLADRVDESLDQYKRDHDIAEPWETRERVLVAMTGAPHADRVIRRAARIASRSRGVLLGVHVIPQDGLALPTAPHLERQRALIEQLGGTYLEVVGDDPAEALLDVARSEDITQVVLGATRRSRWQEAVSGSVINRVVRGAGRIDVHVISSDGGGRTSLWVPRRGLGGISRRRRFLGLGFGLAGLAGLTMLLTPARADLELASVVLLYLGVTVIASAIGGLVAGLVTGLLAFAIADFYFTDPLGALTIADSRVIIALIVFMLVAVVVSVLVDVAARRASEATRARAEATALSDLARVLFDSDRPLERLVDHIRTTLGLRGVALLRRAEGGWTVEAASGAHAPTTPDDATDTVDVTADHVLAIHGPQTLAHDRRVLTAFAAQVGVALESRMLARAAANAGALEQARNLRDALLAAVSHDLRTPLASMKAAATSLQQTDVDLSPDDRNEFVSTIVTETDRLNRLVGNVLDMSRIHSGALDVHVVPVGLDEIVPAAVRSLAGDRHDIDIDIDIDESLSPVLADPGLLERIVANLLANARKWSPPGTRVRVVAGEVPEGIDLRVVDHGPGIEPADRARVFEPFQRTGDHGSDSGVGLGLAVARGFAKAIGASLVIDDTPGGGTTMVLRLQSAAPRPAPPRTEMTAPASWSTGSHGRG